MCPITLKKYLKSWLYKIFCLDSMWGKCVRVCVGKLIPLQEPCIQERQLTKVFAISARKIQICDLTCYSDIWYPLGHPMFNLIKYCVKNAHTHFLLYSYINLSFHPNGFIGNLSYKIYMEFYVTKKQLLEKFGTIFV